MLKSKEIKILPRQQKKKVPTTNLLRWSQYKLARFQLFKMQLVLYTQQRKKRILFIYLFLYRQFLFYSPSLIFCLILFPFASFFQSFFLSFLFTLYQSFLEKKWVGGCYRWKVRKGFEIRCLLQKFTKTSHI